MSARRALDLLGFSCATGFHDVRDHAFLGRVRPGTRDAGVVVRRDARALNRAIADFCAHDKRLLPVGFVPLDVPELAEREIDEAIKLGCRRLWIPRGPAGERSPTHPDFDGVWARLQDANMPFMLHIGAGGSPIAARVSSTTIGSR